mgnify:FL=1|jgi:hypothetical protein|tara:strand:- start:3529 stop:3705 length:177 start_codon:yes stop_codon:yes gene_type:complete
MNETLPSIPSIKEYQKKGFGEIIKKYLSAGWIFEKFYEKIILVVLVWMGIWKLIGFFI